MQRLVGGVDRAAAIERGHEEGDVPRAEGADEADAAQVAGGLIEGTLGGVEGALAVVEAAGLEQDAEGVHLLGGG
ncbi:MAG: hypothetical protein L0027_14550 [Candidatus Rokubacteria bacterium]|nr:hypothetical protein [Candidatus Rokubacteria bacterium]